MEKTITIESGGKQYRTQIGGVIKIENLSKKDSF